MNAAVETETGNFPKKRCSSENLFGTKRIVDKDSDAPERASTQVVDLTTSLAPPKFPGHQFHVNATQLPSANNRTPSLPSKPPSQVIMSPSALNGDETVGSGGPRQMGKATPETLKYVSHQN